MGPLNADRFRRAKTRPDEGDDTREDGAASLNTERIPPDWSFTSRAPLYGPRTKRILLGNRATAFGVVGRTLIEACGDFETLGAVGVDTVSMLLEEAEEAFECV